MKILLAYPKYPDSYWSFKHALRFIKKKAVVPPLGLLTVSAMLPPGWGKKLADLNVAPLNPSYLDWADYVFISATYIQKKSVKQIIESCKAHHVKIVAGGPLFTQEYDQYPEVDHLILNEAEITLQPFLDDLASGRQPQHIYRSDAFASLSDSPIPDYHLANLDEYAFMNFQVSRGCPYNCDFCEITALLGRKVRRKSSDQVIATLQRLYDLGWRGAVGIVDDNFIGQIHEVKQKLLPRMHIWMEQHDHPFKFNIQSSINMADDEELLDLLASTGFNTAFVGIETPDAESLHACDKIQNQNRNLLQSVIRIQQAGIQVTGGFIVGFDSDEPSIFQRQIDFINNSGIVAAMVGLLNAPKNTRLYRRLQAENRLTEQFSGDNTDMTMNFIPKMNHTELVEGYRSIIRNIYCVKPYYRRTRQLLLNYRPRKKNHDKVKVDTIIGFIKTLFVIGIGSRGRREYWKFLLWTLLRKRRLFIDAVTFAVYGYHFRKIYGLSKNE